MVIILIYIQSEAQDIKDLNQMKKKKNFMIALKK